MSGHRFDIEALAHPNARAGTVDGGQLQLVRVRLLDGPGTVDPAGRSSPRREAFCDLVPGEARQLAAELIALAGHAERVGERERSR